MKNLLLFFIIFFSILPSIAFAATVPLSSIQSGDLVRGQTFSSVYYYGADGFRYVFPNDKTYFTWYSDFKDVKWISDADLAKIQIGGNVTYKPGVKMLKINSDPRVYAVSQNGTLRPLATELIAIDLYGKLWNKMVDDVPDGFFGNYKIGSRVELISQYAVKAEQKISSVNDDKQLAEPAVVHITNTGYNQPTIHIPFGKAVRFINDGPSLHSVTQWDRIWGSGTMQLGDTFSIYPPKKGTWMYYSVYDPKEKMTGAVIVE